MVSITDTSNKSKFVLVDAYALIYRAYHALPPAMVTSRGETTNAVFGFTQMLLEVLRRDQPEYVAMAFDMGRTFRHDAFAEYKGTRAAMPDDLRDQIARVEQVVEAFNIPIYRVPGFEADDVIGTLAEQARKLGVLTLIVTGDTDTLQLVRDDVYVITPGGYGRFGDPRLYDVAATVERYGFQPPFVADYKALTGDTSDNIPKLPGIGEKTATTLIQKYGTVAQIYEHLDEVKPDRIQKILRDHAAQAEQNKMLTTIVCDVPITLNLDEARTADFDRGKVVSLFRELEFRSLLSKLPIPESAATADAQESSEEGESASVILREAQTQGGGPRHMAAARLAAAQDERAPLREEDYSFAEVSVVVPPLRYAVQEGGAEFEATPLIANGVAVLNLIRQARQVTLAAIAEANSTSLAEEKYQTISTRAQLEKLVGELRAAANGFTLDTETDSQEALLARLVGISLAISPEQAYYIPVDHRQREDGERQGDQLRPEEVKELLGPLLADESVAKGFHNAKFDLEVLEGAGYVVRNAAYDTQIAAYLLGENDTTLKGLAFTRLGVEMTYIEQLIGKRGKDQITFDYVPIRTATAYSGADSDMTQRLYEIFQPEMEIHGVWDIFKDIEMPLVPVLVSMEQAGIAIDVPALNTLSAELDKELHSVEQQVYKMVGHEFKLTSPQQLQKVLFEELRLPPIKSTATGFSTDRDALEKLSDLHPVVALVSEHRSLSKLKGTYVDSLPDLINPRDGRVHTNFNQTVARTGRLSSSNPNLQNIPVRTDIGRQVREAFIADNFSVNPLVQRPSVLISADYSQIELRILAALSQEPTMVEAFSTGLDIHQATAARLFTVPLAEVKPEQRRLAKTINFGLIYGMGTYGFTRDTGLPHDVAKEFIARYWAAYPQVRALLDEFLKVAKERGYATTMLGRRRYIPELNARNVGVRQNAERAAINTPVQGTNADIIKIAMVRLHKRLRDEGLEARMLLQVHDELVFELPEAELEQTARLVREVMEGAMDIGLPLKVEVKVGERWGSMKPLDFS